MKKILPFLGTFFLLSVFNLSAQNPLVKMWDKTYGGLSDDEPAIFQQTSDGGYVIGGYSSSDIGGDKTEPLKNGVGILDFWIIKIDSAGNLQWNRDFGGANGDQLASLQQTSDGGYILGGMSASDITGDKTQATWGNFDYWILKLDSSGNKLWDKDFGGAGSDQLNVVNQTIDGGYILAGSSASVSSGNKTSATWGALDYWIVKIDSAGNKVWDKNFGGSDNDKLFSVQQTIDGGYMLGGSSWSPVSGNKSEPSSGMDDYWVIKIDSLGNKEWDKDFGGTGSDILYSLLQTGDGGYALAGRSGSDIGGNKTQPLWGGYDYWVVKINSLGIKEWDKDFGGADNEDEFGNISFTDDGGYLIAGTSYSFISGNKTENNLGQEQTWFLKLDSLFNVQWDKTVFTSCHDEIGLALQTSGQCYAVVNSNGPSCGAGGYRTQSSWNGSRDYWIVKFCDSTYFPPSAFAGAAQSLCPGSCTSFLNASSNAISYQWNFPGASPDTSTVANPSNICYANSGSYDVELIAMNLHGSDTLLLSNYITVYPTPAPQGIMQSSDTLFANQGAASYQWYLNGNIISGATDYFFVTLTDGDYNVICTNADGCEVEAAIFGVINSIQERESDFSFEVYPNPVGNKLSIISHTLSQAMTISIANIIGERILAAQQKVNSQENETAIDVNLLPPGIYWIEISTDEKVFRNKFIKQ